MATTWQVEKKHLCKQAGQTGKSFKGGMKCQAEEDQESCEEVEDRAGK